MHEQDPTPPPVDVCDVPGTDTLPHRLDPAAKEKVNSFDTLLNRLEARGVTYRIHRSLDGFQIVAGRSLPPSIESPIRQWRWHDIVGKGASLNAAAAVALEKLAELEAKS